MGKLHKVVIDKTEPGVMIKFCTEQEFRVIQIRKFIKNYMHQFTNVNTKKITVIEVGAATLLPHDPQSIISCLALTFPILGSKIFQITQSLK